MRSDLRRRLGFVAIVAACVLGGAAYVAWAAAREEDAPRRAVGPSIVLGRRQLVFRTLDRHSGRYGEVAVRSLARLRAAPRLTGLSCERVYAVASGGLCLARARTFGVKYDAIVFGRRFAVRHRLRLNGVPSRARVSPDGRYGSITAFVSGHSYASAGEFSTQTLILDLRRGTVLLDGEQLDLRRDGRRLDAPDRNIWGVTFAGGSTFYATVATGKHTYLFEGDVRSRRGRVLRENAECPSLSPDGGTVVYKKRVGDPWRWRLHALDLRTGKETPLAETRSVDDQVEWLDAGHVLYRVDEELWSVRTDGRGAARRYLAAADSPAVVA